MATKTLNTRFQLKYDTYANWTKHNPTPLKGELCIVVVPASTGAVVQEPAYLLKVGDGEKQFNDLGFISGVAADVYDWAKAAEKPKYAASEIENISTYIADYVGTQMGISVDTDTQYTIVKVNDYQYKLQSKAKGAESFVDTDVVIDIPKYDDTEVNNHIDALEALVGSTAVATQIANAIAVIQDGAEFDSFKDVEDALKNFATKEVAQGYADAKDADIAAAKKAGDDAQAAVDTLKASTESSINSLTERTGASETKITTLIGEDANKSVRTIANEELAKQLIPEDAAESLDTLTEIAQWIQEHPDDAAAMNSAIEALQAKVDTGDKTVSAYVADAIAALNIGDYAKAADLTALAAEVNKKANDADLATIAKTGNVNDLVQTAGDYLVFYCGNATEVI